MEAGTVQEGVVGGEQALEAMEGWLWPCRNGHLHALSRNDCSADCSRPQTETKGEGMVYSKLVGKLGL